MKEAINGATWDFTDYLTEEMVVTFRRGKQVWSTDNHGAQKQLILDALNRAKYMYQIAKKLEKDYDNQPK